MAFADRNRVAEFIAQDRWATVAALERILDQKQLDELELLLVPDATALKVAGMTRLRDLAKEAGAVSVEAEAVKELTALGVADVTVERVTEEIAKP